MAPPKIPKIPKIPKPPKIPKLPKPGWKPPKGFLPGYTPGHPPHHGSGGHSPVIGGGHVHDNDHASPARSCIHPKGMDRLRCEKADAVVGTLFAIIALLLLPFLIYMCIRYWKRRKGARKDRNEEDGMELTRGGTEYYSGPQTDRGVPDGASNIGLAITTSQKSITLTKEQTQDRSSGSSPGRVPPPAYHPSTRSVSRGQEHSLYQPSERSVRSSFSSGMIRTASSGQALQDAKIVDLPPSLAGSRRESERRYSSSDVDRSSGPSNHADGEQHCSEEGGDCADNGVDSGETQKEADRRSRSFSRESRSRTSEQQNGEAGRPDEEVERRSSSSSRRSCSPVSEHQNEQEGRPDNAGSRCSSRRSSSHDHNDQHEEGEEGYVTAASETGSLG